MLFSNNLSTDIKLCINGNYIETINVTKFLGVFIHNKLNWKHHVYHISNKLSKCIGILHKTKPILNQTAFHILHCSTFLPYVYYCADVWENTYKSTLQPISLKQKQSLVEQISSSYS